MTDLIQEYMIELRIVGLSFVGMTLFWVLYISVQWLRLMTGKRAKPEHDAHRSLWDEAIEVKIKAITIITGKMTSKQAVMFWISYNMETGVSSYEIPESVFEVKDELTKDERNEPK